MRSYIAILTLGLLLMPAVATAQQANTTALQEELQAMRQELAATKLALQQTRDQIEEIKAFLEDQNAGEQFEQWKAEREKLAEERRLIRLERQRLEATRQELHRQTMQDAQAEAAQRDAEAAEREKALEPNWSAQYMLGLIDVERQTIYVRSTTGRILVDQYPSVDRRNVMIRGTFLNKSQAPWRYTFQIALADANPPGLPTTNPRVVGSWRYQTPLLEPGELHAFEIKVPVTDVRHIDTIQIGNVTADRPAQPQPQPQSPAP